MGTCIESAATAQPRRRSGGSALHLSDVAARRCLHRGHHHAAELDLIVNVGLYKDHALAEPALASMIQEDIGANPGHPPRGHHGTFSFDVLDGGCGLVTAARLIDGFVASSAAKLGMIVAADADPAPGTSRGFPFVSAGGALLLSHSDRDVGFAGFLTRTFPSELGLFEVTMRWQPRTGLLRRGRNVLEVYEAPAFATRCIEHGIEVARELLDGQGLAIADVDVLVTSQYPRSFALGVARGLGIPDRLPRVAPELVATHTAGPIAALEAVLAQGRPRNILLVTAGAGISIATALYVGSERAT